MTRKTKAATERDAWLPARLFPEHVFARIRPFVPVLVLVASLLFTALAYGPTRDYSLLFDDALDLTRTENRGYWQILSEPFPGFGYYRPVPYLIFKASFDRTGEHHAGVLRSLALLSHAVSAWLLYLLVRRLTGSDWAIAAGALFLLFPFGYQTLGVIGAIGHVLVTLFLLSMLLLWYEGRVRGSPILLVVSITFGVVAVWTVEYGVLALPLLIGLELVLRYRDGLSPSPYPYLAVLALAHGLYVALWFMMDKPASESVTLEDVARNLVVWLQAAAYPGTRFLSILWPGEEVAPYRVVAIVSALVIAGGLAGHLLLRQIRTGLVALGVAAVAFLPSILMLSHEYVLSGPRLLYVAAPAIATFWALLARAAFDSPRISTIWRISVAMLLVVTLLHSYAFIERRVEMFGMADNVVRTVVDLADANPDRDLLLLNTPSWFAFHAAADQEYPVGHLGAQAIPTYLGLDGLYYAVTGRTVSIDSVSLAPDVSGGTYAFGPHGRVVDHDEIDAHLRAGQELHVMRLHGARASTYRPGDLIPEGEPAGEPIVSFGDLAILTDLHWQIEEGVLKVASEWHSSAHLEADYQVRVEAVDERGEIVLDHRDYALGGMSPPRLWQPGDRISDYLLVELRQDVEIVEIWVSLLGTADGTPLEVTEADVGVEDGSRARFPRP